MRTITGEYRIDYYNKYGERMKGLSKPAGSFGGSHKVAERHMPTDAVSYTVMRCVYNSLDKEAR